MRLLGICDESEIMKKKSRRLRLFFWITFILQRETASGRKMEANSCWSSTPPRESLGCGVAARGNTMSGVSLPACQAKVGPVWQPLAPQSHLGWALPVLFGGVRETLLPSAPSQGTNLGADMQGGQGQIHYKYTTIVLTTTYKCTTDSRQHTNTLQIQ